MTGVGAARRVMEALERETDGSFHATLRLAATVLLTGLCAAAVGKKMSRSSALAGFDEMTNHLRLEFEEMLEREMKK